MNRAVFLDRDGVLNEPVIRDGKPYPPPGLEALVISPDAPDALARLKRAGFLLIVVTNQPDVAYGKQTVAGVHAINAALSAALPLDEFAVCWHSDADSCACRKPKPGLILDAAARHSIDVPSSFLIGDRWRDIDAAAAAGCRAVLIDRGYRERGPARQPDFRAASLLDAAQWILAAP